LFFIIFEHDYLNPAAPKTEPPYENLSHNNTGQLIPTPRNKPDPLVLNALRNFDSPL